MAHKTVTAADIDALLPQTQCGLCGYAGCLPYAEALVAKSTTIDRCPPGGTAGLRALGEWLNEDPTPFLAAMEKKAKPPLRAIIREAECIGCTKCIQACPVDAIVGAAKWMHTVISDECTGCELCIAPCPVDCIAMVPVTVQPQKTALYRQRYYAKQQRSQGPTIKKAAEQESAVLQDKKGYIERALARAKIK